MGLGDIVQKAVYLGVGLASFAGEKASEKLGELQTQVQKLADEMVERGEMTTDEARRFVDDMVNKAQQPAAGPSNSSGPAGPRQIEILEDEQASQSAPPQPAQSPTAPPPQTNNDVEEMRRRVMELQDELRRLKNN
jgi:polyhydroxyalkanoate synthesis regulator phasin